MSGGQFVRIELFAIRGPCSLCVEAGKSLRGNLCLGCIFVRRERSILFRRCHTPIRHVLIVFSRCLSISGSEFRSFGNNRGLSAGGKRSRCEHDGEQSDGRHAAPTSYRNPTGNKAGWNSGGTVARRSQAPQQSHDFTMGVIIASQLTTHRAQGTGWPAPEPAARSAVAPRDSSIFCW
jgi:hypothetical protein